MSNQIQINTVTLPDGTTAIEINDGSKPDGHVEDHSTFTYERSDIPQSLIDECNKLGEESDKIFFIFDKKIKNIVNRNNKSIEVLRDIKIEEVLDNDFKYYIADENEFNSMPSRFAYYDSEIRLSDRYDRYNHVLNFFKILNFEPGFGNFGPELEQAFFYIVKYDNISYKIILRIHPNLFIHLKKVDENGREKTYNGFFSKSRVYDFLKSAMGDSEFKDLVRDSKLKQLFKI
jgi:hypothetical protein